MSQVFQIMVEDFSVLISAVKRALRIQAAQVAVYKTPSRILLSSRFMTNEERHQDNQGDNPRLSKNRRQSQRGKQAILTAHQHHSLMNTDFNQSHHLSMHNLMPPLWCFWDGMRRKIKRCCIGPSQVGFMQGLGLVLQV